MMDEGTHLLSGQQQARIRWGTQEAGAAFDRKKLSYLTLEAQEFIGQRAFCVIGGLGEEGQLHARLAFGGPGFVWTPDRSTCLLELDEQAAASHFIRELHRLSLAGSGGQAALFFISHATRERLCVYGAADVLPNYLLDARQRQRFLRATWLRVSVRQAFFHCPRYIRTRVAGLTAPAAAQPGERELLLHELESVPRPPLSAGIRDFIARQVSCFLCTINREGYCAINHRGGPPGFLVSLAPDASGSRGTLLLPDYEGNGAFEALGNILETRRATLVIPDYGLHLALIASGPAHVLEPDELSPDDVHRCAGAQRVISLAVEHLELQDGDWSASLAHEQAWAGSTLDARRNAVSCPG